MSETKKIALDSCPKCKSDKHVREKLLAINLGLEADPELIGSGMWSWGGKGLQVPRKVIEELGTQTFLHGLYCDECSIGFLSNEIIGRIRNGN